MQKKVALIIGSSELGTACAIRLFRSGIQTILIENDCPLDIYHARSFSSAVFLGFKLINNITAKTFAKALDEGVIASNSDISDFIDFTLKNREIPIVLKSDALVLKQLSIEYIIICNRDLFNILESDLTENGTKIGFDAEINQTQYDYTICNASTYFGCVMYPFNETTNLSQNIVLKKREDHVWVKAPIEGVFQSSKSIDEIIHEKEEIGKINGIPILSPTLGRINGILNSGLIVPSGTVFTEIDTSHSGNPAHAISKESFCLAGAVLEAIMYDINLKEH